MKINNLEKVVTHRKELHKIAELSGFEKNTANRIKEILHEYDPDKLIENIGGYGIAAVFGSSNEFKVIIRAELDALPIKETNEFNHKSLDENVSHKCGHDGHMAILIACADYLSKNDFDNQIILLFQPSEENGKGAEKVINDPKFKEINPDYILSLHNLPGYKKNQIILKQGIFAAASKGMVINLEGKSTHAAHPEDGISPARAITKILSKILDLNESNLFEDFSLATPIYTELGERAFGTAPHKAEILITLRAYLDSDLKKLESLSEKIVKEISLEENLNYKISWDDPFTSTINDNYVIEELKRTCLENKIEFLEMKNPFRWSEDFGVFTHQYRGAMFGIGSGVNSPQLHNPDYDFPDEIIPTAVEVFLKTIKRLQKNMK